MRSPHSRHHDILSPSTQTNNNNNKSSLRSKSSNIDDEEINKSNYSNIPRIKNSKGLKI